MHNLEQNSGINYLKVSNNASSAIFMIHGYGASMHDLYDLAPYLDQNKKFDWYFPDGILTVDLGYHMQGKAWFPIDMEKLQLAMMRGEFRNFQEVLPEGFDRAIDGLSNFVSRLQGNYDQIIVGGFSQGAMLSSHLTARMDDVKALMLFSGVLAAREQLEQLLQKRSVPAKFFQSHGKQDPLLNYADAAALYELLKLYRWQGSFNPFEGGHEIPMPVITKAQQFLQSLN